MEYMILSQKIHNSFLWIYWFGRGSRKVGGKNHGMGVGCEKQAEKPTPEANRYVGERKLGVGAEK
mgnify:FL=1